MAEAIEIINEKEKTKRTLKDYLLDLFDIVSFLVFVWWIVLFIRFFIFNPYTVVWQSMEPTFEAKDFIIVDKITPRFGNFHRWDIIVFVPPGKDVPYIKRIIWLPGETVKILDGDVYICNTSTAWEDCKQLEEDYLSDEVSTKTSCGKTEFQVEWGYFVLWDNRDHSTDSRCCFSHVCYDNANFVVPKDHIIGKVYIKIFPGFDKY